MGFLWRNVDSQKRDFFQIPAGGSRRLGGFAVLGPPASAGGYENGPSGPSKNAYLLPDGSEDSSPQHAASGTERHASFVFVARRP